LSDFGSNPATPTYQTFQVPTANHRGYIEGVVAYISLIGLDVVFDILEHDERGKGHVWRTTDTCRTLNSEDGIISRQAPTFAQM